jgi:hypothetical protein
MPWAPIPVLRVAALAYLLAALERNAEAETAFRRVFELAPRGSTAWFNLGFLNPAIELAPMKQRAMPGTHV